MRHVRRFPDVCRNGGGPRSALGAAGLPTTNPPPPQPQWRRAEIGPRSSTRMSGLFPPRRPQWRRAEIGPRSTKHPPPPGISWLCMAAMEEGRDRPSETRRAAPTSQFEPRDRRNGGGPRSALGAGYEYRSVRTRWRLGPQWRRAEIGPRSLRIPCLFLRWAGSGRNGGGPRSALGECNISWTCLAAPLHRRNGGGPRSALGGSQRGARSRSSCEAEPQWRRAEIGPRSGTTCGPLRLAWVI